MINQLIYLKEWILSYFQKRLKMWCYTKYSKRTVITNAIQCIYIQSVKGPRSFLKPRSSRKTALAGLRRTTLVKLIGSLLSDGSITIRVDSLLSNPYSINSGVPQGSIIHPVLFILFKNDLLSSTFSSIHFCWWCHPKFSFFIWLKWPCLRWSASQPPRLLTIRQLSRGGMKAT